VRGSWAALVGEVDVAVGRSRGGNRERLPVHPRAALCACAQVSQDLIGRGIK